MSKTPSTRPRREGSLSRDRIIDASIELLDSGGAAGLTFRALSERLATGAGAIYWHIDNKSELLTAAGDALIARTIAACVTGDAPEATLRAIALGMFDLIDAHPWVGSALAHAPGELPVVRLLEAIGQPIRALGVPPERQWSVVSALLNYIMGVGGQNAANAQFAQTRGIDRTDFLDAVAATWSALDEADYPFTRSVAEQLGAHDDRGDFIAGVDLILAGIRATLVR